jgi:DNA-binding PadR family transcriptional regulator
MTMPKLEPRPHLPLTPLSYQVLLALADADRHGYGIIKEVSDRTEGEMELETGTLYTALRRLKGDGLLEIVARASRPAGEDSRRRTYRLTPLGRSVLKAETARLAALVKTAVRKKVLPAPSFGGLS